MTYYLTKRPEITGKTQKGNKTFRPRRFAPRRFPLVVLLLFFNPNIPSAGPKGDPKGHVPPEETVSALKNHLLLKEKVGHR